MLTPAVTRLPARPTIARNRHAGPSALSAPPAGRIRPDRAGRAAAARRVFADTALFEYGDVRWVGNAAGVIEGENWNTIDRRGDLRWRPVEVDTPPHKLQWFWHPNSDQMLKSVDKLVQIREGSVGRGGQLAGHRPGQARPAAPGAT
ncbi:hypothetical protein [Xanthomonas sacchari]|uniref:hypothetical protein n=1 Tax=Xanthomonas sacchari TaxID=56458 RepID=UPI00224EA3BA|nr:hypothetical protein [Xanthomonas sacchari]MCW0453426.1 hypothetical protein [Xanthomonas sacchari]